MFSLERGEPLIAFLLRKKILIKIMDLKIKLEQLFVPILHQRGLDLVRLQISGQQRPTLQVMIERLDNEAVSMEDCVGTSREISALMDVEDPIQSSYRLEITSPGLDRPLMKVKDFQRFLDHEIKFQLLELKEGRKRFQGFLEKADDQGIAVRIKDKEDLVLTFNYDEIKQANLVPEF